MVSGLAQAQTVRLSPAYLVGQWHTQGFTACGEGSRFTATAIYEGGQKEADYSVRPGDKIELRIPNNPTARIYHWARVIDQDHYLVYRISSNTGAPPRTMRIVKERCASAGRVAGSSTSPRPQRDQAAIVCPRNPFICHLRDTSLWGEAVTESLFTKDEAGSVTTASIAFRGDAFDRLWTALSSRYGKPSQASLLLPGRAIWLIGAHSIDLSKSGDTVRLEADFLPSL